jgi:uroporphyrin-III C-methyltransferase/precorrin-2 dehydrogenase/sirohydrochlorin ferrochelatase
MTAIRKPTERAPERLGALAKLPIFLELDGKRVVVAGGEEAAVWKVELLAAAGAAVDVFAEQPCTELVDLAATYENGRVRIVRRAWASSDLKNAAVAVGAFGGDEAARFAAAARALSVPVNVIDQPIHCDFQFGAIVNRSPVVIGISTGGAAPILGQAIRRRIEALLPLTMASWTAAALSFRGRLSGILRSRAKRRRFWEAFVDRVFAARGEGTLRALEALAGEVSAQTVRKGEVILVGAGPGDPELLTLKAVRALQAADVIVYDRLVTPGVLELGRREAKRIEVGKRGHVAACRQEDINGLVIGLARAGKRVVRLKGGDPTVFGRAGEEIEAYQAAGIPIHVVPGVTAGFAAAAALNVSLTHRDHAQRVQFVTGHDRNGDLPSDLDLDALADSRATTCVYMAGRTIAQLAKRLIAHGLPHDTPAALVHNVSRADEKIERTNLGDLASRESNAGRNAPVVVLIGRSIGEPENAEILELVRSAPSAPRRELVAAE